MSGAAPAWVEVMRWLHRDRPSRAPAPPPGLVLRKVRLPSGRERPEWFLAGTEPVVSLPALEPIGARIAYPPAGAILALDPDIPSDRQVMFFEASPADARLTWRLDDRPFGSAGEPVSWAPQAGSHSLALLDAQGKTLDEVSFEVRGGPADAPEADLSAPWGTHLP